MLEHGIMSSVVHPAAVESNPRAPAAWAKLRAALSWTALALALTVLAGCASGPKKRIFPPTASIQEVQLLTDGRWQVQLRLQNFSTVAMRFDRVSGELQIAGLPAGSFDQAIGDSVPAGVAEAVTLTFSPSAEAARALSAALENRRGLAYRITGAVLSSQPNKRRDEFEFASALTPMPGLEGVLR